MALRLNKLIFLFVTISTCAAASSDSVNTLVRKISRGEEVTVQDIPIEARPELISSLKVMLKNQDTDFSFFYIDRMLVELRDDETISSQISAYHSGEILAFTLLRSAADVEAIPFLSPDLALPSNSGYRYVSDVIIPPTRVRSADIILACIKRSPELPPETRAWARGTNTTWDETWRSVNEWWLHNQDAITKKDYSHATWLPK